MEHDKDLMEGLFDEKTCINEDKPRQAEEHLQKKSEVMEHTQTAEPQLEWASLPDLCLCEVFWWLGDRDRASAALVCHHWHRVMRSPLLWRRRSFNFSGYISQGWNSEMNMAVEYVRAYGGYLQHLELYLSQAFTYLTSSRFQDTVCTFLDALYKSCSTLHSLSILHRLMTDSSRSYSFQKAFAQRLSLYLLHRGSHLCYLSLRGTCFRLTQGMLVLEAMANAQKQPGCQPTLVTLNLENFFSRRHAIYGTSQFANVMCKFKGLSSLTLNYRCISDGLLQALASACVTTNGKGSLQTFTVFCHIGEPHLQVISYEAWACLAQSCPELKVQMFVDRIQDIDRLRCILLPQIPLQALSLTNSNTRNLNWTVRPILTSLIPVYRHSLEKLTLDIKNVHESVDEELLELVTVCSKLTYLKLWAFLDISFLDRLLQKCLDKQCALKSLMLRLYTSTFSDHEANEMLEDVASHYRQLVDFQLSHFAVYYPMP